MRVFGGFISGWKPLTLLSAAQLASMRDTAAQALPGTAVIQTSAWVSDGGGAGTTTLTASGTVACRVSPGAGVAGVGERVIGARIDPDTDVSFTFEYGTAVNTDSVIEYEGRLFSVKDVSEPRSWAVTCQADAKEIT